MMTASKTLFEIPRRKRRHLLRAWTASVPNTEREIECPRVWSSNKWMGRDSLRRLSTIRTNTVNQTIPLEILARRSTCELRCYNTSSFHSEASSQEDRTVDSAVSDIDDAPSSIMEQFLQRLGPISTIRNPWEQGSEADIGYLDFFPPLDYSSRHLIQLLQELNLYGFHQTRDSASLDRCQFVLSKIFDRFQNDQKNHQRQLQCVKRACAILENMEVFRNKDHNPIPNLPINRLAVWPLPDRVIYDSVLKMFRMTGSSPDASFPRTAQAILTHMQEASRNNPDDWNVHVTADHWKAVLICWGKCNEWQKALLAATETFAQIPEPDADVFFHIMLVCTSDQVRKPQNRSDEERKSVEMGAQVAARLWRKHIQPLPDAEASTNKDCPDPQLLENLSSNFYHTTFRAISALPLEDPNRLILIDELMTMAKTYGRVNTFLLHDFLVYTRKSELIFEHLGKKLMNSVAGQKSSLAAANLFKRIPNEWKARATMTKEFRVNA